MKTYGVSKFAVVAACACFLVNGARGVVMDVGLSDPLAVGDVIHGIQAGGQVNRDVIMVNNLISLGLGVQSTSLPGDLGDLYQRSMNAFGPLPAATGTGAQFASGIADGGALLDINLSSSFKYLVAAYDGPNGGVQVWYIAGFGPGTTLQIPRYAEPTGVDGQLQQSQRYLMTGWSLLNPGTNNLPDGGTTVLMLSTALAGLGVLKRRLSSGSR